MRRTGFVATICLAAASLAVAQPTWLPSEAEEGAAQQLATRVAEIGAGRTAETRLSAARQLVGRVRERLESWGGKGTLERAPSFPELHLPESGRSWLDGMARYQVCNAILMVQLEDPAFADDEDAKMTSVVGLTAFTLAALHLRHFLLEEGGDDEEIEATLTGASMESVLEKIQTEPAARQHVESRCTPPLQALVEP